MSLPSLGRLSKMRESVASRKLKWPSVGAETGRGEEAESSGCEWSLDPLSILIKCLNLTLRAKGNPIFMQRSSGHGLSCRWLL